MNMNAKRKDDQPVRTPTQKLAAKVTAYARERGVPRRGGPIPAKDVYLRAEDTRGMRDDEIIAVINLSAINTAVRHNRPADLLAPECAAPLVAAARQLGLAPVARPRPTVFTLEQSLRSHADAPRLEAALAFVKGMTALKSECPIAVAFSPAIRQAVLALLVQHKRDVSVEIMAELFTLADAIEAQIRLPADFASALVALMDEKGWTSRRLAQVAGVDEATVRQWRAGSEPRSRQRAICQAIETALDVPPGTLLDRMHTVAVRTDSCSVLTQEVRDLLDAHSIPVRALGDDWNAIGTREKRERLAALEKLTLTGNPFRQYAQSAHHEALAPFSNPDFDADFDALTVFKEAECPDLFDDEPEVSVATGRGQFFTNGGIWRPSTSALQKQNAIRLIQSLRAELSPVQQAQLDAQGIGMLTHARTVGAMIEALARRRCERLVRSGFFQASKLPLPKDRRVYVNADVSRIIVIAGYINASTGYLYKNQPALKALAGFIDQDWLNQAATDWHATAVEERRLFMKAARNIARRVQTVRDPWLPIKPLLDQDKPLVPIYRALDRMAADRPAFSGAPHATARHDRDHCLLRLWAHTKLRRSCLVQLTCSMLRWRDDGSALLVVPQELFKNAGSSALPPKGQDVEITIDLAEKALLAALRQWSFGPGNTRDLLCRDQENPYLFPGEGSGPLNSASVHRICMAFSTLYLVDLPWRPGGIPGVLPFGAHAMRDLAATHMIKITNSAEEAAAAIFDTVETIRKHYARFTSAEKSKRSARLFRDSLAGELDDEEED
ncbi:MAG: hypothetical protein EOO23_02395 [Comamonadaceae bacterium]|nr:MAG: hypothetical protein EOO23_02395 [Comamonadaceae bacterium]